MKLTKPTAFEIFALTLHLTALVLVIVTVILMLSGRIAMAQSPDIAHSLSVQLQREYGPNCKGNEVCREWIEVLSDLQPHHDMHPNGQTIGGKAGSTHISKLTPIERARELAGKLKNRAVRKRVRELLGSLK